MFKNDFQGTPFFEIFSSNGTLAKNWKIVNKTFIGKMYDKQVKGYCYSCDKIGRLSLPKDKSIIYLIQPYLNLQIYIPQGANFSLELLMSDLSGDRRRFFLSTAQIETKINALHVNLPMPGLIRGKWVNIVFDLASLMNQNFRNQTFKCLNGLTLSGNFKLRKVFTLKYRPPDSSGGQVLDYDYANRHIEGLPRAVSFPIGVENIVQIFNMNRILIPVSTANITSKDQVYKQKNVKHLLSDKRIITRKHATERPAKKDLEDNPSNKVEDNSQNNLNNCGKFSKLPPISNLNNQSLTKDLHKEDGVDYLSGQVEQDIKTYDPALYCNQDYVHKNEEIEKSSSDHLQNEISSSDQLQNEIHEFFRNCQENEEKEHANIIDDNNGNIKDSKVETNEELFTPFKKPYLILSAKEPSLFSDSLNISKSNPDTSEEELELVAQSLNNLLVDLRHDSEITLHHSTEKDDEDIRISKTVKASLNEVDDSMYLSSDEENEGKLELIFDTRGSSFTDPKTGKCYQLDD